MSLTVVRCKEFLKEDKYSLDLEKIIIKPDPINKIKLTLGDWEGEGLHLHVTVNGYSTHFNEQPYLNKKTALKEYRRINKQVKKGNYVIELTPSGKFKLRV